MEELTDFELMMREAERVFDSLQEASDPPTAPAAPTVPTPSAVPSVKPAEDIPFTNVSSAPDLITVKGIMYNTSLIRNIDCRVSEMTDGFVVKDIPEFVKNNKDFANLKNVVESIYPTTSEINIVIPKQAAVKTKNTFKQFKTEDDYIAGTYHNVVISSTAINTLYVVVKILFPEITVKNSRNNKIVIQDIVVAFSMEWTSKEVFRMKSVLYGTRLSADSLQMRSSYMHSHLPSQSYISTSIDSFCLGTGPINTHVTDLRIKYSEHTAEVILLQLPYYLSWESLEGNPYFPLSNVINDGTILTENSGLSGSDRVTNRFLKWVNPNIIEINLEAGVYDNIATIKNKEEVERALTEFLETSDSYTEFLCFKDTSGIYRRNNNNQIPPEETLLPYVTYGENLTKVKLLKPFNTNEESDEVKIQRYPHPGLTRKILTKIQDRITENIKRESYEQDRQRIRRQQEVRQVRKRRKTEIIAGVRYNSTS